MSADVFLIELADVEKLRLARAKLEMLRQAGKARWLSGHKQAEEIAKLLGEVERSLIPYGKK